MFCQLTSATITMFVSFPVVAMGQVNFAVALARRAYALNFSKLASGRRQCGHYPCAQRLGLRDRALAGFRLALIPVTFPRP